MYLHQNRMKAAHIQIQMLKTGLLIIIMVSVDNQCVSIRAGAFVSMSASLDCLPFCLRGKV